jgi:DNA-binding HxlR family transcriptional regulator
MRAGQMLAPGTTEPSRSLTKLARRLIIVCHERRVLMLLTLLDGPASLRALQGDRPRQEAQRELQKLKHAGLVERDHSDPSADPVVYRLTNTGRKAATAMVDLSAMCGSPNWSDSMERWV